MVALDIAVRSAVVALNVPELEPAATVTEDGTVSNELLSESAIVAPPDGAAPLRETVQVELPRLARMPPAHDSDVTVGSTPPVTIPPVNDNGMKKPSEDEAKLLPIAIVVLAVPAARVRFTTATVPSGMIPEFDPAATQV
ncbi:MAG: hypothetical protein WDO73_10100 [Ignavibacteriota bacterium]